MPWAAGVYTRGYPSWSADAASNLPISATKFDTEDNDFAAGLNNCLTKDGLSTPNAPMTWGLSNGQILNLTRGSDGVVLGIARTGGSNNPALQFSVADNTGVSLGFSGSPWMTLVQAGGVTFAQPVAFSAGSGISASFQGVANQYAVNVVGSSTSGQSFGESIKAGTTSADVALLIQNQATTATFLALFGNGQGQLGPSSALGLSWSAAGNFSLVPPTSGAWLTLADAVTSPPPALVLGSALGRGSLMQFLGSSAAQGKNWLVGNQFNLGDTFEITPSTANGGSTFTTPAFKITGSGAATFNTPTSGIALTAKGLNNNFTAVISASTTSGQSFGLDVLGGTNSSDEALQVNNAANSLSYFIVLGDGSVTVGSPAGGGQGVGSINAVSMFQNGGPVYSGIPQNAQNAGTYQFVLADNGKSVVFTNTTATWTIPANASVAFPIGAAITIVNGGSGAITLAITTDTLNWYKGGSFSSGTRTIAAESVVTLLKIGSTTWVLTGNGIS